LNAAYSLSLAFPSSSASFPSEIPPIIQHYHSNRQAPALQSVSQSPAFHPFIGTRLNLPATSIANQARLASASNTIPRQVSLPVRGRRRTAQQPPRLPRFLPKVSVDDCLIKDAPVSTVRVVVRVLPPLVWTLDFYMLFLID
jgi:hypothetical protein